MDGWFEVKCGCEWELCSCPGYAVRQGSGILAEWSQSEIVWMSSPKISMLRGCVLHPIWASVAREHNMTSTMTKCKFALGLNTNIVQDPRAVIKRMMHLKMKLRSQL